MDSSMLDRLAADLKPVRPQNAGRDLAIIAGFLLIQLAALFLIGLERVDLGMALRLPEFWLRLLGCALVGLAASLATVRALSPADRIRSAGPLAAIGISALAGLALLLMQPDGRDFMGGETVLEGMSCTKDVLLFALPLAAVFAWMLKRGAPARPRTAALVAALAAAGWGGALFAFHCPHDTMAHTVLFIPLACFLATLVLALALRRFARW